MYHIPIYISMMNDSSKIRRERIYTGPHRVGPNRPAWARSISALKLLSILRDVKPVWRNSKEYLISDGSISKIIKYFSDGSISEKTLTPYSGAA